MVGIRGCYPRLDRCVPSHHLHPTAPKHRTPTSHATSRWSRTPGIPHPATLAQRYRYPRHQRAPSLRLLESNNAVIEAMLQSPVNPGHTQLHLHWRHRLFRIPVTFVFDPTDTYSDGTPDFLRLHTTQDRQAFRAWFTTIAEHQADQPAQLPAEINDCAALLRYAYREALHAHDETWLSSHALQSAAPSIRQYAYPQTPLGANLFRIRPGPFLPADLNNGSLRPIRRRANPDARQHLPGRTRPSPGPPRRPHFLSPVGPGLTV